jgi:hypothetical protein
MLIKATAIRKTEKNFFFRLWPECACKFVFKSI